jgi:hypothetical protein
MPIEGSDGVGWGWSSSLLGDVGCARYSRRWCIEVNSCIPCGVTALGGMSCVLVACSVLCQYGVTVLISSEWEDVLRSDGKRQPIARRVKAGGVPRLGWLTLGMWR